MKIWYFKNNKIHLILLFNIKPQILLKKYNKIAFENTIINNNTFYSYFMKLFLI